MTLLTAFLKAIGLLLHTCGIAAEPPALSPATGSLYSCEDPFAGQADRPTITIGGGILIDEYIEVAREERRCPLFIGPHRDEDTDRCDHIRLNLYGEEAPPPKSEDEPKPEVVRDDSNPFLATANGLVHVDTLMKPAEPKLFGAALNADAGVTGSRSTLYSDVAAVARDDTKAFLATSFGPVHVDQVVQGGNKIDYCMDGWVLCSIDSWGDYNANFYSNVAMAQAPLPGCASVMSDEEIFLPAPEVYFNSTGYFP